MLGGKILPDKTINRSDRENGGKSFYYYSHLKGYDYPVGERKAKKAEHYYAYIMNKVFVLVFVLVFF